MSKFILSFFAGLLSISSVFFLGDYVKAASPYDNSINLVDRLEVYDLNSDEPQDISTDWSSIIRDENTVFSGCDANTVRQSFIEATTNTTGNWAVSQVRGTSFIPPDQRAFNGSVRVSWSEDGSAYIAPDPSSINFLTYGADYRITIGKSGNNAPIVVCNTSPIFATPDNTTFPDFPTWTRPFFSTIPINYPPGYDGIEVPDSVSPPARDTAPAVVYTIADLHLEAAYLQNVDDQYPYSLVCWRLYNENDDQIDQYCGEDPYADRGVLYQYDFDTYGTYYLVTSLHAGPPPSAPLPDNILNTVTTLIVDGSTYTGVTDSTQCGFEDGAYRCEKPLYEDCSIYENFIDAFACHFRNFGIWLKELFLWLFVPTTQWFENYFTGFRTFMEQKLGMIFFPIGFLIDLFGSMANNAINTSCSVSPDGQLFGAGLDINVCRLEQSAGNIANAIFAVMRSVVVMYLIFALYRKYLEVVKS